MGTIFVVLAFYGDGSLMGAETVVAVFASRNAADRFVELAEKGSPSKEFVVVPMSVEP